MNETREQFRERIGRIVQREAVDPIGGCVWEEIPESSRFYYEEIGEAVYVQALRDFRRRYPCVHLEYDDGFIAHLPKLVERFASESGIELEPTPAEAQA